MLSYLLKVTLCWALFYLLYHLWLGKETFFKINRWYLIGTALLGLAIPAIDFQWLLPSHEEPIIFNYLQPITVGVNQLEAVIVTTSAEATGFDWWELLVTAYWIGAAVAALRFGFGLFKINKLYNTSEKLCFPKYLFINTPSHHVPFSFFKNLFWSKNFEVADEDRESILRHEEAHIFQWHSADVVLFEILGVLFWCSPFIYLYKKAVKTTHEYLADDYVLAQASRKNYGRLLLRQSQSSTGSHPIAISNSLFSSQLKQRIVMMTKNKSSKTASLKYLAGLPLLALLFLAFSFNEMPNEQEGTRVDFNEKISADSFPRGDVFKVVDEMPHFPGCEDVSSETARKRCADKKMLEFIYSNIKYPQAARDKGTEGMVVVKFIVEKDGSINNAEIKRSIGDGCDEEVLKVVGMMPNWMPGKQKGEVARVQFLLPVKFRLDASAPDPKPVFNDGEEIFKVVEDMPLFPGCEEMADKRELKDCSQKKMLEFIYTNIKYPQAARDEGIEGMTVVQFVVEKDGSLSGAKMLRSIGGGCDEEVLRLIGMMPNWTPGKQQGKAVRVQFNLPVKFKLDPAVQLSRFNPDVFDITEIDTPALMAGCEKLEKKERISCTNSAITNAVYKNIRYPKEAKEKKLEGKVVAKFIIGKDGNVRDLHITQSLGSGCDKEVLRVISAMPKWMPAMKDGKPVAMEFGLPIEFKLNEEKRVISIDELEKLDQTPRFAACDEEETLDAKENCAHYKMNQFIAKNIRPENLDNADKKEGTILIKFTVAPDGTVQNASIKNGIGSGHEHEFLRVVKAMPKWMPAIKNGKAVAAEVTLPLKIALSLAEKVDVFEAYPNPSNENGFTLKFKAQAGPIQLQVVDMAGRKLASMPFKDYDGTEQEARFDGLFQKNAQRGTVFVTIMDGKGNTLKGIKVVIQ